MASLPRRIVLTGSESTGKTTLAAELAAHFGTIWVPEFSRRYAGARAGALTVVDLEPIGRGQRAAEDAALAAQPGLVVFDTDLLSTSIYGRHYYGVTIGWIEAVIREYPQSLYLLCDIDLPWAADGVRDREEGRAVVQGLFRDALEQRRKRFGVVSGNGPDRLKRALDLIATAR